MDIKSMKGFSEEIVSYISESRKEPQWMKEKRLGSWEKYSNNPIPDSNDESWRKTDISSLKLNEMSPFNNDHLSSDDTNLIPTSLTGNYIVHRDSAIVHNVLSKDLKDKGVIFTDMNSALKDHPDIIKKYFMTDCVSPAHNTFALLHSACWNGGTLLYVPAGIEIDLPFSALYTLSKPGIGVFNHTLIVLEESSKVSFHEEFYSDPMNRQSSTGNLQSIASNVVEMYLKDGAILDYFAVQNCDNSNVYNFNTKRAIANRDSSTNWTECVVGAKLTKSSLESILKGPGANTNMLGVSFTNADQHLDTSAIIHHTVPNTNGNILVKGVTDDNARTVFQGMIRIDHNAQSTSSYMGNHNLLLSDNAKADSTPKLEIEADEVKATHGVTVGQVDEEQLFYLQSRGLNENDAKELIVDGFLESIINMVDQEYAQDTLRNIIKEKRKRNA